MEYEHRVLENGLSVYMVPTHHRTIEGRLSFRYGSANELPGEEGLAHLLEHCMVDGGTASYSPQEIEALLRALGGRSNALTNADVIALYGTVRAGRTRRFIEYLAEAGFVPRIDPDELAGEKEIVTQEYRDYWSPENLDSQEFRRALFGDVPEIRSPLGSLEVIQNATREQLLAYHARGCTPSNAVLTMAGGLPDDCWQIVSDAFGRFTDHRVEHYVSRPFEVRSQPATLRFEMKEFNEHSPASVFLASPHTLGRADAGLVLTVQRILSDRVRDSVRERHRLAYSAYAARMVVGENGVMVTSMQVHPGVVERAIDLVFDIYRDLQERGCSERELVDAEESLMLGAEEILDSISGVQASLESIHYHGVSIENDLERIASTTVDDVKEFAQRFLPSSRAHPNYVLAIRGPPHQ